jgi:hypothetical protein
LNVTSKVRKVMQKRKPGMSKSEVTPYEIEETITRHQQKTEELSRDRKEEPTIWTNSHHWTQDLNESTRKFTNPDSSLIPLSLRVIAWVTTRRHGVSTAEFEAIQLTIVGSLRKKLRNLYMNERSEDISEEDEAKTNATQRKRRIKRTPNNTQRKDTPSIPFSKALKTILYF